MKIPTMLLCLALLSGCATSLMARTSVTRTLTLPTPPADAYRQAAQTFARFGGQLQVADPQSRTLSGVVHGAVILNVSVDSQSVVLATATLMPGKLVVGSLTEAEDYLALLTQEALHAR